MTSTLGDEPLSAYQFRGERENRHVSSPLDCTRELALMLRASAGHSAGKNLTPVGHKVAKLLLVFIIKIVILVFTELTNFYAFAVHGYSSSLLSS